MLTWLAARSGESDRQAASFLNTDNDKLNFLIHSRISHKWQRNHICSLPSHRVIKVLKNKNFLFISCHLNWMSWAVSPPSHSLCPSLQSERRRSPPVRGTWSITAWKWPDCVCILVVSPILSGRVLSLYCATMCGMVRSRSARSSRGTHLALCGFNENERAVGPDSGED